MKLIRCFLFFILFFLSTAYANPPQVLIFDFGGVIAKVNRKPIYSFLSESLNVPLKKINKDFENEVLFLALRKPLSHWEKYAKTKLTTEWFSELREREEDIVQFIPGMLSMIETLKKQGIQVAILSNTGLQRANFIQSKGGYGAFDPVVLSCDVGVEKPDSKIFNILLKKLEVAPDSCLFIDDRKDNIEAGEKLGMPGIVFKSLDQLKAELTKRGISL